MERKTNKAWINLAVLILVVLTGWYVYKTFGVKKQMATPLRISATSTQGQLVQGFPSELIIAKDAVITASTARTGTYNGKTFSTFSATYVTKAPVQDVFNAYIGYANSNGYQVVKSLSSGGTQVLLIFGLTNTISLSIEKVGDNTAEVIVNVSPK
jgi:hypothetical protein